LAPAILAIALIAGACGNSTADSKASPTTAPASDTGVTEPGSPSGAPAEGSLATNSQEKVALNVAGVTDTEIRVGGVASVTNILKGKYGDAFAGVKAYFDNVNSTGGIYGRKLVLVSERDDKMVSNKSEIEALISSDNVFAIMPVASLLFSGADSAVSSNVPTFGWTINPEWEGNAANPKKNLFGQTGSFLCFDCDSPFLPWLAKDTGSKKIGVIAYSVPQSSLCADGVKKSFDVYGAGAGGATIGFVDQAISYGTTDFSVQVSKMKDAGVDLITTCMDTAAVVALAKETKKQGMAVKQYLPNGYDHEFVDEFGDLFEGSFVRTDFPQWELPADSQPAGLKEYLAAVDKAGIEPSENSLSAWMNADLLVTGLRAVGPNFDRQKLIDAINSMTNYKANGLAKGVNWTKAHSERGDPAESCSFLSVITGSAFSPNYSEPGKPFFCVNGSDPANLTTFFSA